MAQEVIWAGSSSFSSGDTPWSFYDTDNEFTSSADKFADWSARRLGYPICLWSYNLVHFMHVLKNQFQNIQHK